MTDDTLPDTIVVVCHECGAEHLGTYSHLGQYGEGPIYAVVCTADDLTDYYTLEAAV